MKQILEEKLLSSDFTFGFELEALERYWKLPIDKNSTRWDDFVEYVEGELGYNVSDETLETLWDIDNVYKDNIMSDYDEETYEQALSKLYDFDDVKEHVSKTGIFEKYFGKNQKWIVAPSKGICYDGSLGVGGFEYRSPVMKVTPEAIQTCINFLLECKKVFYVDRHCGFHTHLAFNGITEKDAAWITMNLAMDDSQIKNLEELKPYVNGDEYDPLYMISNQYSSDGYLYKIRGAIYGIDAGGEKGYEILSDLLDNTKYRLLRIHPQGTLEWRGPRDFLDEDNDDVYVKSFFLKFYNFVDWMKKVLDKNTLPGCSIDRDNLLDIIFSKNKSLFSGKVSTGDSKLIDKILKDPKALLKLGNVNPTRLVKILYGINCEADARGPSRGLHHGIISDFIVKMYNYGKTVPDNIFTIVFLSCNMWQQIELIKAHKGDLPIKEIYSLFNRVPKPYQRNSYGVYYTKDATGILIENKKLDYLYEDDVINIIKETEAQESYIWAGIICRLNDKKQLTKRVANAFMQKYNLSLEEFNSKMKKLDEVIPSDKLDTLNY